jgi:hypothetical protein
MSIREAIIAKVVDAGGQLTVRSALNPILWLCAIVSLPGVVLYGLLPSHPNWLVGLIWSPVAVALFGFLFLLFFDRDKLQSEDFQIKKRSLEIIGQKGEPQIIDTSAVEIISGVQMPSLKSGEEK